MQSAIVNKIELFVQKKKAIKCSVFTQSGLIHIGLTSSVMVNHSMVEIAQI